MRTFCEEINKLRTSIMMERIGVSRQAIALWRNGESLPAFRHIPALANLLNLTAEELSSIITADVERKNAHGAV